MMTIKLATKTVEIEMVDRFIWFNKMPAMNAD